MINNAPNLNALWASLIVEELTRNGVTRFVMSPGSRSAPLALAAAQHPKATSHVHFDERGAAFFALGQAKATLQPIVLMCTSGTAVANYTPAFVEAAKAHVPLIALTADRPPELLDTGANQTIDQAKLFGVYSRWHHTLPCPDIRVPAESVLTAVGQAVYRATQSPRGPVHINCMFREPLAPIEEPFEGDRYLASIKSWANQDTPYTHYTNADAQPLVLSDEVREQLANTKRPLLVVGQLHSKPETHAAEAIAQRLGWPMLPDITSGLRMGSSAPNAIYYYDQLLKTSLADEFAPADAVLHLGGSVVSKGLLTLIAQRRDGAYIRVADHPFRDDPAHRATYRIQASVESFAAALEDWAGQRLDDEWMTTLRNASDTVRQSIERFTVEEELNEIAIVQVACNATPKGAVMFLGNSRPIRDADACALQTRHQVLVAANRGVSGIDGNIATVAGYAHALGTPVLAVIGDIATLHDLNSLALLESCPAPVVLTIVNNNGGGIFSMLPIGGYPEHFEQCFGTPHGLTFEAAAAQFRLNYRQPSTAPEFADAISKALATGGGTIIEIMTDRAENAALHQQLDANIAGAFT